MNISFEPHARALSLLLTSKPPSILSSYDTKVVTKAKEVLKVFAALFLMGLTYSFGASTLMPAAIFGLASLITLLVIYRFNSILNLSENSQNLAMYRFDYQKNEKKPVTLKFKDGTLRMATYLLRAMVKDQLLDGRKIGLNDEVIVLDKMSWKELMRKLRQKLQRLNENEKNNLFLNHSGISCFHSQKERHFKEDCQEKLLLLKTLGASDEDNYLREAIENMVFIPTSCFQEPPFLQLLKEAFVTSFIPAASLKDDDIKKLEGLAIRSLFLYETQVTENGLIPLLKMPLKKFSLKNVGDLGLRKIGEMKNLETLFITVKEHSVAGTESLVKLPLKILSFRGENLTKMDIITFGRMASLSHLLLSSSVKEKFKQDLEELVKKNPKLKVIYTPL